MVDGGHIDEIAARQGHVAGDARALLSQGLLGDLDEDFLAGLEHLGDQLRAPRGLRALLAAVHGRTLAALAAAAHGALEAGALRVGDARGQRRLLRGPLQIGYVPLCGLGRQDLFEGFAECFDRGGLSLLLGLVGELLALGGFLEHRVLVHLRLRLAEFRVCLRFSAGLFVPRFGQAFAER